MIIHVTESWGGGVQSAIESYVDATPELAHMIIVKNRGYDIGIDQALKKSTSNSFFGLWTLLRAEVRRYPNAVIHFHSTFAGLLRPFFLGHRIVYSPHCFSFEMSTKAKFIRFIFFAVEYFLSPFTSVFYAISQREVFLANKMRYKKIIEGCNYVDSVNIQAHNRKDSTYRIGMVGRIEAQKNPKLFAEIARTFMLRNPTSNASFHWIGSGDEKLTEILKFAGVEVIGWVNRKKAIEILSSFNLYIHSSAWEGSPLTPLEAATLGVPIISANHSSMKSLGYRTFETVDDFVDQVYFLENDLLARNDLVEVGLKVLTNNSKIKCHDSLLIAYVED